MFFCLFQPQDLELELTGKNVRDVTFRSNHGIPNLMDSQNSGRWEAEYILSWIILAESEEQLICTEIAW